MKIPFKKINLGDSLNRIAPLIDSGFIGLGNTVYEFEKKLADYVGAKEVVAVDSCTSAIFLSLIWEKERQNLKSVVIPSMTVPLVACAIKEAGLQFTFSGETDWVGSAYPIRGSFVLDSAHQLTRNQFKELTDGLPPEMMFRLCFSFYPTKTIGSADGGAIATNDSEFAEWARKISTYGRNQRQQYANSWEYDVEMYGYKRHWTNLQAAIALEQLERLPETAYARNLIVAAYNNRFGYKNTSEYLYRLKVSDQKKFIDKMAEAGIECGVHFKPLHLMTPFHTVHIASTDRWKVEKDYHETVSLPLYDKLTDEEVGYIMDQAEATELILPIL